MGLSDCQSPSKKFTPVTIENFSGCRITGVRLKVRFNLKLGDHVGYAVRTFPVVNTQCGTRSVPYLNGKTALLITPV